jgi:glycerol-3-phosphate dehydrogenase
MSGSDRVDVLVIGGGINGCGIARDLAGRGYTVALAEKDDLASGTSSWSTKLIHGGLRYLEHYEFRLVREALREREVLWRMAPHVIRPLRFVLPHHSGLRPSWLLRLGLFLYDSLGGQRSLPGTRTLDLSKDPAGKPLRPEFTKGFEYSDCRVDDSRLVVLNARDAADRGAAIHLRTAVVAARPDGDGWVATLRPREGADVTVRARMIVNAAGPWVDRVLGGAFGRNDAHNVRLVQGSHIVVPRLYDHDRAYIFQNADKRIIFAIPYEDDFTLIGTTDRDWTGEPGDVAITGEETDYLLESASAYFRTPVRREDIVWTFSGVRPLYDDGASAAQEATRDYVLKREENGPPLLNIFGGKLTTYRKLAEAAVEKVEGALGGGGTSWTGGAPLPGGDMSLEEAAQLAGRIRSAFPFVTDRLATRLSRLYGTRAMTILDGARRMEDLGRTFGADLTEREVRYLMDAEWAMTADDVLWRRTKLGLRLSSEEAAALGAYMAGARQETAAGVPAAV